MNILVDGQTLETEEINRGIGVYFKNVLYNMICHTTGNVWYITVSKKESLKELEPWLANRLVPIVDDSFAPSFDYGREEKYTDKLNEMVKKYRIDCMWNPNPLMVNVLFPCKKINCELYVTVHDLIPYVMPIKEWAEHVTKEYRRRLEYLEDVHMICVSNATKKDVEAKMGTEVSTFVTLEAANSKLFYKKRTELNTSDEVSVVFTGGFDYRKNIYAAIEAFALAKKQIKNKNVKFTLVCKVDDRNREMFEKKAKELGIENDVWLSGYVTDEELVNIYHKADVFFFPSLYEGFGLPLLEAMLGGAYVLSADNSSLPEVCGEYGLFCNAKDVKNMAEKLVEAVNNSLSESLEDKQARQEYALTFTWKKTALQTYAAMEKQFVDTNHKKKKVALVTPWPKHQTGISTYIYKIMPYITKYMDIDLFIDNTMVNDVDFLPYSYGKQYFIKDLDEKHTEYDEIIYQMGNNTDFHKGIYEYLRKYPGIVELHDYAIHGFFYHTYYLEGDKEGYRRALIDGYGEAGAKHFADVDARRSNPDNNAFPMSTSVTNLSKEIIVHNVWSYNNLPVDNDKYVIPLVCFEENSLSENELRKAKELICNKVKTKCDGDIIIGCFGWVNDNKRPDILVKAVAKLIQMNYKVKLVFFGKNNSKKLEKAIEEEKIDDYIAITGYISDEEYQVGLAMCDIVVNLRHPSMGESSATLCEAFKAGKPVIVTAVNQYLEFPDDVCWKLKAGHREEPDVLATMIKCLIDNEDVRIAMGNNAKEYADEVLNCNNIARMYSRIINQE